MRLVWPHRKRASGWSLRRTLLAILLTLTIVVWGFSAVVIYREADQESAELFDRALAETAHLLLNLADHEIEERRTMSAPHLAQGSYHTQHLLFQIWDGRGQLSYKNTGAPDAPIAAPGPPGLGWASLGGQQWRTYTAWNASGRLQIQVGEPGSHRKEISARFAYRLFWFVLLMLPLTGTGIWWAVNRVFRVLQEFADAVSRRTPSDLHRVSLEGAPSEVHPLLHAINQLFDRVRRALEHEQRFTADAAHELRTPLAAIKTNLQVMQRARNDGERAEFISGLGASVERAIRLVEQLMALARLDPRYETHDGLEELDLGALLAAHLPALQSEARKWKVLFEADLQAACCLVHQDSFLLLLRNLMDNAFRYTPQGGSVTLSCHAGPQDVCVRIADSGAGIAPDMRARVFERFVRLADGAQPGSGLGLSIVRRIADIHGATLSLGDGLHGAGLAVELRFPAGPLAGMAPAPLPGHITGMGAGADQAPRLNP